MKHTTEEGRMTTTQEALKAYRETAEEHESIRAIMQARDRCRELCLPTGEIDREIRDRVRAARGEIER